MAGVSSQQQTEEVATVKADNPHRCRVMCDMGKYTHIVTVQPMNMDATIKFQLEAAYPMVVPMITVRSEALSDDNKAQLQHDLQQEADKHLNTPMIQTLVDHASFWLKDNKIQSGKTKKNQEGKSSPQGQRKKKKKKKEKKIMEDVSVEKLVSMKTADDVIKRIMWDGSLESDEFLVGYWDRFRGIVEKYFSAFSWEDLASVDYTVLAIPKHRIQYFKYKKEIVWDKGSRLDNVFGSTGSKLTIIDVIARYDQQHQEGEVDDKNDHDDDDDDNDSDSDDSDDGITVTIGSLSGQVRPADSTHYVAGMKDLDLGDYHGTQEGVNSYWRDKLRPNYFLAVRVTDQQLLENLEVVQDYILEHEPRYISCCIPCNSLHITLCTVGLDTPEQVNNAVQALQKIKSELATSVPKTPLKLVGVSNFYNRVVYAKVEYPETFTTFVDHLKLCLKEVGIDIRDGYEFVPHMTIMKTSRAVSRLMGTKNISPFLYEGFSDMMFGSQHIDGIYLCSMGSERREDGFYVSPCHLDFKESE